MSALNWDEPFGRSQANRSGLSDRQLQREVREGVLVRPRRGVYADALIEAGFRRDVLAASTAYSGLPLSVLSAAVLYDVPIVGRHQHRPEMTVAPRGPGNIRGVHAYRARVRDHELRVVHGRLCLSPARTAVDIARHYPLVTAVAALDNVLHRGLASADEIRDVLDFCRRWPGAPAARRAVLRCDSRSESALESLSRLVFPKLGLPAPEPQVWIIDEYGHRLARCDFYWDEVGLIGEADGRDKYTDMDVVIDEKEREVDLRDTQLAIARWGWSEAWTDHATFRRRLVAGTARGSARDAAGVARRWTFEPTSMTKIL